MAHMNHHPNDTNTHAPKNDSTYEVKTSDLKDSSILARTRTAGTISLPPDLFEKLYLSPQNKVAGDLRGRFANPTPLAIAGVVVTLTPLTADLMGWRGAGRFGYASIGQMYFMGGLLEIIGSIFEFFLGNTFSFVLFGVLGGFFFAFGATLTPAFNAFSAYSHDPSMPGEGLESPGFNASFAFAFLGMGLMSLIFAICALRTNICLLVVMMTLALGFPILTGAFFARAEGDHETGERLLKGAGGTIFVGVMIGWYLLAVQMFEAVDLDFGFEFPVGDLSGRIKGKRSRAAAAAAAAATASAMRSEQQLESQMPGKDEP